MKNKYTVALLSLFLIFVALHLFGIHIPYHQDEYKWVLYAHPEITPPGEVPHPPLTEFIYTRLGPILGDDNFRFIPFGFGLINFFLLFYLVKYLYNKKIAVITSFLFTLSFYSLLASLTVDVDGAVMPFFFLLLSIGYFKWKELNFSFQGKGLKWLGLVAVGSIGGFMIKLSGLLPLLAFVLDFAIEKRIFSDFKKVLKYSLGVVLGLGALAGLLVLSKFIFPFFRLEYSMTYWEHFANSSGFFARGWLQTFIQFAKSILYSSPLLVLPLFFVSKEMFKKLRPFFLFIFIAMVFYLFIFDFSIGALDRYFQFLVIPLCLISAVVYERFFQGFRPSKKSIIFVLCLATLIFSVQFLNQSTPPLYPKTEWLNRMMSFRWDFLYPFSGGSGPLAFYVSFAVLGLTWVSTLTFILLSKITKFSKSEALFVLLVLGLLYNGVFIEEYLFGKFNGSSSYLVKNLSEVVKNNSDIKMVTVYNDNGGWEIQAIKKYRKRLYIDPKFDVVQKVATLNQYKEHYMVVDIPHIDSDTVYAKYFGSCLVAYQKLSGYISGTIYDCRGAPDLKI